MDLLEKIFATGIIVGLSILLYLAVGYNLDKPVPCYERGKIISFETPDGQVYPDDPRFEELVSSYR
tara:strand:- start:525 stop:722 length:198 start_codon:yes stop_codon:yes gene_type:complete